jgi:tRNA-2-methylthio-N6-dimethylallyladenosine synthase
VTLLGQNVNSYGKTLGNGASFSKLLKAIGSIKGIERIRFTTSHPKDLTEDVIHCFAEVEALCEHIHLPVQSGSDAVLNRMNRGYTRNDFLDKIKNLRKMSPSISITSDVIVGFPGETEKDFCDTLELMEIVRFDNLFSFKYSDRPGTAAAMFDEKVGDEVKSERLRELQAIQETYTLEKNKAFEGLIEEVLVEGKSKNAKEDLMGRTRTNRIVNFRGDEGLTGKIIPLRIMRAYLHSLRGELL